MKDFIKLFLIREPIKYLRNKGVKIGKNTRFVIYPYFWSLPLVGSDHG
jgi:hypothetical protein